jgi:hypothetical protein
VTILTGLALADVDQTSTVRTAVFLLWVRGHVTAPFWQQWVQQLPEEYTASGPAWSREAILQLQWPFLQVWLTWFRGKEV